MSLTEALFSPFGVYVVDRSTFFLHLVFMSLSEALFFSISCLCRCQKHFFSPFGVYVVDRSLTLVPFAFFVSQAPRTATYGSPKREEFFYNHFYSELTRNVPILNYQKVARLFLRMKDDSMRFEESCKQKNSYSTKMKCYSYYKISK